MSDIASFPYRILWGERHIVSIASLTRRDGEVFFRAAARTPIQTTVQTYPLSEANQASNDLRDGQFTDAAVLLAQH